MKKSDWAPVYERLNPFIEDAARTHYSGDKQKGFKFWAVSQVLMDMGLSDDALKEPLLLDGRGDSGLDGYYEDAEETWRCCSPSSMKHPWQSATTLSTSSSALRKVLDPNVVVAAKNPLAQDAHRAVRDAISKGWTLRFVFVTSGYLSPEGRAFAEANEIRDRSHRLCIGTEGA